VTPAHHSRLSALRRRNHTTPRGVRAKSRFISQDKIRPWASQQPFFGPDDPLTQVDALGLFFGSTTQVGYWSHAFQNEITNAFQTGAARVGGNVAVVEFANGARHTFASGNRLHSEQAMVSFLRENNISPTQVARIYSELSPCLNRCLPLLREYLDDHAANVHLEFTWFHGADNPNRLSDQRARCGG